MTQDRTQPDRLIGFKVEHQVSNYPPLKEINEVLITKLNKQIQSVVDKRIGPTSKYSINYGELRLIETTLTFRARSIYELKAELVITG